MTQEEFEMAQDWLWLCWVNDTPGPITAGVVMREAGITRDDFLELFKRMRAAVFRLIAS